MIPLLQLRSFYNFDFLFRFLCWFKFLAERSGIKRRTEGGECFSFSPHSRLAVAGAWLHSNTVWLSYLQCVGKICLPGFFFLSIFPLQTSLLGAFPSGNVKQIQPFWGCISSGYLAELCVEQNRYDAAPFCSSGAGHQPAITLHLSAILTCLFRKALTTRGAPSPLVIQRIAALNVPATVLWHYKLTVAFIKQEMKRGTANIGIWPAVRIPINSRCHCGHVGLSCANEQALQLSAWWICVNAVSSWTERRAGVAASSPSPLHSRRPPGIATISQNEMGFDCRFRRRYCSAVLFSGGYIETLSIKPAGIIACGKSWEHVWLL